MRKQRDFMSGYKKYDPAREGFGSPRNWRGSFHERMGFDEASATVGDDSPHAILEISVSATWSQIKSSYRKLAMLWHPDKYQRATPEQQLGAEEKMKRINAAYVVLEHRHGKT